MRWVVYGAGAVGGTVGARLSASGHDVVFIARGRHLEALRRSGLRVDSRDGSVTIAAEVVSDPAEARIGADDVVLLAMKSQHTVAALDELRSVAANQTPIVCLQNGVHNEREALRRFANVYGVCVMCPTAHLAPGVVEAYSTPVTGILDVGCFPTGVDATADSVAAAFAGATFSSEARPDIARWKYMKLLTNLGNAAEVVCGPAARSGALAARIRDEGVACLRAAGIDFASDAEDAERRGDLLQVGSIGDRPRGGGSSWQSLRRHSGSIETDYLNGEIVLLGRMHNVPTPANALIQQVAREAAYFRRDPGCVREADLLALLDGASV